jgi:urocanate hydratase
MLDCGEDHPLALDPIEPVALDFLLQVERHYASLIKQADSDFDRVPQVSSAAADRPGSQDESTDASPDREPSLGGKLLYAGELDAAGRALLVAGNIAGAGSLAATADLAAQKQAVRDGVADFLVTSLSEALRILKNQIRKREPAAVCVASSPETLTWEMLERGVLPDLLRPAEEFSPHSPFVSQGARLLPPLTFGSDSILLTWRAASAPALWLTKLDAVAIDCLQPDAWSARRWLRLSPRYLGRMSQSVRLLYCDQEFKADFIEKVRAQIERGEIGVQVEIQVTGEGMRDQLRLSPPGNL